MKHTLTLLLFCIMAHCLFAQKDTTVLYLNKERQETAKDSAYSIYRFYKQGSLWHGREVYAQTNIIRTDGDYTDSTLSKKTGLYKMYKEDGVLDYTGNYKNDTLIERAYYYATGQKKSSILYKDKNTDEQKGWDINGNEIKGYIVEREARFPGGAQGWQKYLEKNLNSNAPVDAGMAAGMYRVEVSFLAGKDGSVSEVKALNNGNNCKACVKEVIRVISSGPDWEPAIQNNEPVIYRQRQQVTFQVDEAGRKKKKKDD